MLCENKFCLYQENRECGVSEIELDISGLCKICIYVNITDKQLSKIKDEHIRKFIKRQYQK